MTTFEDREKAFEAKYRLDQETEFKVHIRRDKLLGLWAAAHLGLADDAAKAYALSVVDAEFTEPDHDACHKVMRDFAERGVGIHEDEIRREALRLQELAREQVVSETLR
ncbi:MAG: DUF1476 domain-containing protein [Solirubrobacterales bacterium]